jgi:hypothetical protein
VLIACSLAEGYFPLVFPYFDPTGSVNGIVVLKGTIADPRHSALDFIDRAEHDYEVVLRLNEDELD